MKILHTADLHLGAPMRAHLPPREAKLRRDELLSTFHRLLQLARQEKCTAVLIAGDLFDSAASAAMLAPTVLSAVEECREIDFYYVSGNHERDEWLAENLPKNFHVFGNSFSYFAKDDIVFFGKSNPKHLDFENICLQKEKINILVLHGAWSDGAAESSEIPLGYLKGKEIDYCALGHYHTYQTKRIDARGIAVYAGCPQGRGFDETGEKGAVLIETAGAQVTHRFLPLNGRVFHRIEVDVSEVKSLLEIFSVCEAAVSSARAADLLRLVLIGKRTHCPAPDPQAIERHLSGRFYYLEVEDSSCAAPNLGTLSSESSFRGEFVRTVLSESEMDNEEKMRILSLGLTALGADTSGGASWS